MRLVISLTLLLLLLFSDCSAGESGREAVAEAQSKTTTTSAHNAAQTQHSSSQNHSIEESIADSRNGFLTSFVVITMSEIGDKTFLIAAILAMKHARLLIFLSASSALVIMTVLSASLGYAVPNLIPRSFTQLLASFLFLVFGLKMLKDASSMPSGTGEIQREMSEVEQELSESKADSQMEQGIQTDSSSLSHSIEKYVAFIFSPIFLQTFSMTFLAEWGDRSQITTIALGAADDFIMVTLGASVAHCMCTGAAVLGGRYLASKISVRTVTIVGGVLFILFALTAFINRFSN